jgi:hypothetical protein
MAVYPKTRFAWERECFALHLTHIIMHPAPWGSRVLMPSIIPRCSWCGEDLKREEMYVASEDWLNSKKIEDAWDDVLIKKQMSCYQNWFGRLYESPEKHLKWDSSGTYDGW